MLDGIPYEIRTRVTAVKGQCPRPLDERDVEQSNMRKLRRHQAGVRPFCLIACARRPERQASEQNRT